MLATVQEGGLMALVVTTIQKLGKVIPYMHLKNGMIMVKFKKLIIVTATPLMKEKMEIHGAYSLEKEVKVLCKGQISILIK